MIRSRRLVVVGALCSAFLTAVPAPAQDCVGSMFWAAESLEARDAPREAVIADLNGDGLNDLAVAVYHLNAVQVSLRRPDGTYASQSYFTGYQPDDLATGDIDGDSDLDLVVVNSFDRTFAVLKNGGTGLFTVTETRVLGFAFGDLALGDLDGDGDLDVVSVGTGTSREFSVFLNTGGSFAWSRDYTVAGVPSFLVLAQLDADGALDVAVTSIDDNSVSILWNLGTGVLGAPVRLQMLTGPRDIVAGDVNGDGRLDLLTAHGASGQVAILLNQGARNIALWNVLLTGVRTDYLDLGDVDQDGDLDLGITGTESGTIDGASILLNDGTGDFIAAERFDVGDMPLSISFGDLDGDGDADVVVTNQSSDDLRLYTNRAGRMATASRTSLGGTSGGVEGITHGDLNGDGRQDLVIALRNQVQVLTHVGGAVFAPPVSYPVPTIASGVAAGDVTGDGAVDVVVAGEATDDILVLINSGGGALVGPARFPACDSPSAVVLRDMDGDQDLDVVVSCFFSGGVVKVLRNNGFGGFTTSVGIGWGSSSSPYSLAVGDMDGDGDRDFVVGLHNSNLVAIGRNDGSSYTEGWSDPGCNTPESVDVADLNGDGRLDIAASCRLGARVRIYLNAGGGTFTLGATPLVINPLALKLADMDGDGDQDLVVVRGNTRAAAVFANDGAGNFVSSRDIAVDEDAWPLDVVDWDGDGDLDLATGGWSTRISTAVLNTRVGCPAAAALSVAGGSVPEGDAGTRSLSFAVALSTPVSWPVTVDYATADGTATAGSDYEGTGGTLTFAPGETQKTVAVSVWGDTSVEPDETFWLDLSNAAGAPLGTAQAGGTIVNDDDGSATQLLSLDLTSVEDGAGFVTMSPSAEPCTLVAGATAHCEREFATDATVTLVAQAALGSAFSGWTGACTGTGDCVVSMTEARQVGASFLGPRTVTVQLTSVEGGHGIVSVSPAPLGPVSVCELHGGSGGQVCTFQYPPDTPVALSASAFFDSKFVEWSGACTGAQGCVVLLAGPGPGPFVDASFLGPRTVTVQLTSVEGGRGSVSVSPAPLGPVSVCELEPGMGGQVCAFQYPPDTPVALSASAFFDSKFVEWSGACTGAAGCVVLLAGPGPGPFVDASFLGPRTVTVQLTSVEGGRGSVSVSPAPLGPVSVCELEPGMGGQVCAFQYPPDTPVALSASAFFDSKFVEWSGACTGAAGCVVLLEGPGPGPFVDASFLGPRTVTVQLTSVEGGRGSVSVSPAPLGPVSVCELQGGSGGQVCAFQYPPDTPVALSASAFFDSKFVEWSGACTGATGCVVLLEGPGPGPFVDASFLGPRTVTVQLTSVEGGRGSVSVSPAPLGPVSVCELQGGSGGQVCAFQYPPDTQVTFAVVPFVDSKFNGWSGACVDPLPGPCQVFLAGPGPGPVVEGSFLGPRDLALSIVSSRGGRGSLAVQPASLSGAASCELPVGAPSAACALQYAPSALVTVTALPEPGSVVRDFGGSCPPQGPCTFFMTTAASVSVVFEIPNRAPTAHAGGPYAAVRGQAIVFNGSGSTDPDGDALSYQWNFGDGATGTGVAPLHAYGSLGTFVVSLVVSDGELSSTPATASVTIANLAPVVSLTSPADGSVHPASAPIALEADAVDADGVIVRVEYYAGAAKVGEAFSPPYTASWTGMAAGDYVLTAQATDDSGTTTTSAPRLVHVNPSPAVALTAPTPGATFVAPATVALAATASDDGAVTAVEFYQGSTLLGLDTTSPYTLTWASVPAGRYVLTARALDDVGGAAVSAPVTIDVVTVVAPVADSSVREGNPNSNFGNATALDVRVTTNAANRWTYLRFNIGSLASIQAAKLRLFGNLSSTTTTPVQTRVFSSANVTWVEGSITWNNKPAAGATVLASAALVINSTAARWYEWDLTAFLQAERAAGRTAVTLVLKNDVATPNVTFRSRQASSNRPELRITP